MITRQCWMMAGLLGLALTASPGRADDDDAKVVATVQTAVIRSGEITENLTAYGSVAAEPGVVVNISQPVEVHVVHLRITPGQKVAKQTPLADVEPSLDAKLQWQDARDKLDSLQKDLTNVQQRFDMKLATNAELLQAQQAVKSAQLTLDNLKERGAGDGLHTLSATVDSLISKVDVQDGQIVPAGSPLIELVPTARIGVRLGVDPTAIRQIQINQPVQLFQSDHPEPITGKIQTISLRLNSDTRLVDVFVIPTSSATLLLDSFARGQIALRSEKSLLVLRSALLPNDQGYVLFTIKDSHAVKHTVEVDLQNDTEAAVRGEGLHTGDIIVVQGNLELDDGMAVATQESK